MLLIQILSTIYILIGGALTRRWVNAGNVTLEIELWEPADAGLLRVKTFVAVLRAAMITGCIFFWPVVVAANRHAEKGTK